MTDSQSKFRRRTFVKSISAAGTAGLVGLSGCMGSTSDEDDDDGEIRLVTSTEDTAAYQMAQGVAAVVNEYSDTVSIDARPSDGSRQAMTQLDRGEADIGYTDLLTAYNMYNELEEFEESPFENEIQQVTHFYDLQSGLVTTQDSGIETIEDLPGAVVSPGPAGTSTRFVLEEHLNHGIDVDELDDISLGFGEGGEALTEGRADVVPDIRLNVETTPSYIEEMYAVVDNAVLLEWPDSVVDSIQDDDRLDGGMYDAATMEGPEYGDRDSEWWTTTQFMLFANDNLNADNLHDALSTIWEHRDELPQYHNLLEDWTDLAFLGDLDAQLPTHSGAERFFDELE